MRICFCIDTMESGGAERVASILCNEFYSKNHSVDLVMISETEAKSFYPLNEKINLIPLLKENKGKITFIKKINSLKRHFKNNDYDAVISFLPNVNICVWLATPRKRNFVHLVSERNNPFVDPQNKIKRWIKEISFKKADGIVCQTNDSKKYYESKSKKPITVIKNPLNSYTGIDKNDIKESNTDIISVGRLEPQKNFEMLIEAFSIFNKKHPETNLKIYGTGELKEKLEGIIKNKNLENKAFLCGTSKTWIRDNLNCAMFISSSLYEGMPNVLLEALAYQMPCIASDCPIGGSKELLDNDNGLLFENNNLNDLLGKMECLYKNSELISKFRKANKDTHKSYSPGTICDQWISFIEKVKK